MAEIKTELVSFGSEHNLNAFWVRQIEESRLRKHGDKARDDAMSILLLAAATAKRFPTLSGGSQMLSVLSLPLMSTEFRILNRRSSTTFRRSTNAVLACTPKYPLRGKPWGMAPGPGVARPRSLSGVK